MGRPTQYKAEYNEQAYKLALLGATDAQMADFFSIQESTLNNWKQKHPKFLESIKSGKEDADANVAKSLYRRALGYTAEERRIEQGDEEKANKEVHITKEVAPDTTAAIFWLKNRQPQHWRDRQEHHHSGAIATPDLSDEELERIAAGGSTGASGEAPGKS